MLLIGFVAGDALGVAPWIVASAVTVALIGVTHHVPWRSLPIEAAVVAAGLGVLAAAAAPHLGLDRLLSGSGWDAELRAAATGVLGANAANNLPMLLVGIPHLSDHTLCAFLIGVNVGPVLWVTGSLAGLLWLDIVRRHELDVSIVDYARVGARVGLVPLAAAVLVVIVT